jgi:hypothetical protein
MEEPKQIASMVMGRIIQGAPPGQGAEKFRAGLSKAEREEAELLNSTCRAIIKLLWSIDHRDEITSEQFHDTKIYAWKVVEMARERAIKKGLVGQGAKGW